VVLSKCGRQDNCHEQILNRVQSCFSVFVVCHIKEFAIFDARTDISEFNFLHVFVYVLVYFKQEIL